MSKPTEKEKEKQKTNLLSDDTKKIEAIEAPKYTEEEQTYLTTLQSKLEDSRDMREQERPEFDNLSYSEYWGLEEEWANTYLQKKKNEYDVIFQSGTPRQKAMTLLAHVNNLDLSPDVNAYNEKQIRIISLGNAMEDIMERSEDLDNDEEKRMLRFWELFKHGTVFVEEIWETKWFWKKKSAKTFKGKIEGSWDKDNWDKKLKKLYSKAVRHTLNNLNVYLGNINEYFIENQPYIFTTRYLHKSEAESLYSKWDRWKYVIPGMPSMTTESDSTIVGNNWRLDTLEGNIIEEIKFQDKYNNEFAILLNGVLMTPVGMPLPWGWDDYNIAQQNLEPLNVNFAYGRSIVAKIRNKAELLDETLRMMLLKNQKELAPTMLNLSARVASQRIFMPGQIITGFEKGELVPIDEKGSNGVSTSELAMAELLKKSIDTDTVSTQFQGQSEAGSQTATEVLELQRQARLTLGIIIFGCSMLEWKLSWLRLFNILKNWFLPIDKEVVDEAKGVLKDIFRITNIEKPIEGEGIGRRMVIPTEEEIKPEDIFEEEEKIKSETGQPVRIIAINPEEIQSSKLIWQINIVPKEKKSNELSKLLFRAMMEDIKMFGQDINLSHLEEKFATVWDDDPNKLFKRSATPVQQGNVQLPTKAEGSKVPGLPSPQQSFGGSVENSLKQSV